MVLVLLGLDRGYCLRVSVGYEIERHERDGVQLLSMP
jgi:hypothetical protein